jgi:RAB protein geranylgeranyltransferase component A
MVTGDKEEIKLGEALGVFKKYSESLSLYKEGCALLYPTYGSGDLPQGFSRMAAVFEGTFVITPSIQY